MKVLSAIFVAGALALFLGPMRWTPLWMDPQWIAAVLLAFVVVGLLIAWLEKEEPSVPDGSYSPRFYLWIVALLPWLMAAGVKSNSLFDTSTPEIHHQTVISCETGMYRRPDCGKCSDRSGQNLRGRLFHHHRNKIGSASPAVVQRDFLPLRFRSR
jgi:4-amino-4-deoxy-L-arabinose transferase-like glycosyltransferase